MNEVQKKMIEDVKARAFVVGGVVKRNAPVYLNLAVERVKSLWISGIKGKVICCGIGLGCVCLAGTMISSVVGGSEIHGFMGYELGEEYDGELKRQEIQYIMGPNWYAVPEREKFRGYEERVMINVMPKSKRICGILAQKEATNGAPNEIETIMLLYKEKYGAEFKQTSAKTWEWALSGGTRVVRINVYAMEMVANWMVAISVLDLRLQAEIAKEAAELVHDKAARDAAGSNSQAL